MNTKPLFPAALPSPDEMYQALCDRDSEFEGVFFVGVKTTGIFCRPTCPARKPLRKNVVFFEAAKTALAAGFRPCKKCHPLEVFGAAPTWLKELLDEVEADPKKRWKDLDLRQRGLEPARVRRWFKANHGMTFHGYQRSRRLGAALGQIQVEKKPANIAAMNAGYQSASGFRDAFKNLFQNTPGKTDQTRPMYVNRILTGLGPILCAADDEGLHLLEFVDRRMLETQIKRVKKYFHCSFVIGETPYHHQIKAELEAYFARELTRFETPVVIKGTGFQETVWQQLLKIDYGKTLSYEQVAARIDNPKAQRAVGKANGDNRLAIIVPCHRVIRADGSLSGYGGGVWRKRWLLDLEQSAK